MNSENTPLDVLSAGTGQPAPGMFETPLDLVWAGAGYGLPVMAPRLGNGKIHRVGLIWFTGVDPTIQGFFNPQRRIMYLAIEGRIFKGHRAGKTFRSNVIPIVHWKVTKKYGAIPRVGMWMISDKTLDRIKESGGIEFLIKYGGGNQYGRKLEIKTPDEKFLPQVVSLFGRQLFDDANKLMDDYCRSSRVKSWMRRSL